MYSAASSADGKVWEGRGSSKHPPPRERGTPPPGQPRPQPRRAPLAPGQEQPGQTAPLRRACLGLDAREPRRTPRRRGTGTGSDPDPRQPRTAPDAAPKPPSPTGEHRPGSEPPPRRPSTAPDPATAEHRSPDPQPRTAEHRASPAAGDIPPHTLPLRCRRFPPAPSRLRLSPAGPTFGGGGESRRGGSGCSGGAWRGASRSAAAGAGAAPRRAALPFFVSGKLRALTQAVTGAGLARARPARLPAPPGGALSQGRRDAPPRPAAPPPPPPTAPPSGGQAGARRTSGRDWCALGFREHRARRAEHRLSHPECECRCSEAGGQHGERAGVGEIQPQEFLGKAIG
ncbi:proline-rich protein 2-like [Grus americana]|uniref:proline-rich protein 2-like n=1 Tax=Grus americana TaxID=9117 RepID=UPI0024080497|nr:proline-rich protein 2-like [Grus americana]